MEQMNQRRTPRPSDPAALPASGTDGIEAWRQRLVHTVLRVFVIAGVLTAAAGSYQRYLSGDIWAIPIYWGIFSVALALTLWKQAPYRVQASGIIALLYALSVVSFLFGGLGDSSTLYLLAIIFAAGLFFGWRESLIAMAVALLTMAGFAWAFSTTPIRSYTEIVSTDPTLWLGIGSELFMLGGFIIMSLNYLIPRLSAALRQSRTLSAELQQHRVSLEIQIEERSSELARRSAQLEAAAEVARQTVSIRDLRQVLNTTVRLISSRFGFYHSGIFLLDDAGEYAVLRAASSPGGQHMLARQHRLKVGETGIVGYVSKTGEPRIALDVGQDAVYFDNPDLHETRSEMAVPLRVRDSIIGALDVQSLEANAFSNEDLRIMQILADQVAAAIDNARLLERTQRALDAQKRTYRDMSRTAWEEMLATRDSVCHRFDPSNILPTASELQEEMNRAITSGQTVRSKENPETIIATPIVSQGHVIGVMDAHLPDGTARWTSDRIQLFETLADQLGGALESARLFEDMQRRARRETIAGDIAAQIRAADSVERILQSAVFEIGQALSAAEGEIRLAGPSATTDLKPALSREECL